MVVSLALLLQMDLNCCYLFSKQIIFLTFVNQAQQKTLNKTKKREHLYLNSFLNYNDWKTKTLAYSAGFVFGKPVTRVTVFNAPRLRSKSMRSKRLRTLRFFDDDDPPLLKLLCCDIKYSFLKINKGCYIRHIALLLQHFFSFFLLFLSIPNFLTYQNNVSFGWSWMRLDCHNPTNFVGTIALIALVCLQCTRCFPL